VVLRFRRRRLAGLRGILTGGSSGVGRALAIALAEAGVDLVITGRREERLRDVAHAAAGSHGRLLPLAGDITAADFRQRLVDHANAELGGLDLVLAAAGSGAIGPFAEASPQILREIFEVDFFAPTELLRLALPLLVAGRTPAVVLVGSILGLHPLPLHAEYSAAKAALHGLATAIRPELADDGVGLLLAVLGPTESAFWDNLLAGERPGWSQGRPLSAEATAAAIVRALAAGNSTVYPGWRAKAFAGLARLCPALIDWTVRRKRRVPHRS
jgi:short-subunit dehydrogenase